MLSKDTDNILMSFILLLVISSSLKEAKGEEAVAPYSAPPAGPGPGLPISGLSLSSRRALC